jgi:hypothetical protein
MVSSAQTALRTIVDPASVTMAMPTATGRRIRRRVECSG